MRLLFGLRVQHQERGEYYYAVLNAESAEDAAQTVGAFLGTEDWFRKYGDKFTLVHYGRPFDTDGSVNTWSKDRPFSLWRSSDHDVTEWKISREGVTVTQVT